MNDLNKLNDILFAALDKLTAVDAGDRQKMIDEIDRANAVSNVANTVINRMKVELDFMKVMERRQPLTGIIPQQGGSLHTADHAARLAAESQDRWKANNPDKVRMLNQSNEPVGDIEKTA